jgi:hypothetical protein
MQEYEPATQHLTLPLLLAKVESPENMLIVVICDRNFICGMLGIIVPIRRGKKIIFREKKGSTN